MRNLIAISFDCRSWTPVADSNQEESSGSAGREVIILEDVQGDHTATLQLNNARAAQGNLNIWGNISTINHTFPQKVASPRS